jgi:hypothetical protein
MNTTSQADFQMSTTILNYPGFQTLPKGIKQLLVASEAHFFDQPVSQQLEQQAVAECAAARRGFKPFDVMQLDRRRALINAAALFPGLPRLPVSALS